MLQILFWLGFASDQALGKLTALFQPSSYNYRIGKKQKEMKKEKWEMWKKNFKNQKKQGNIFYLHHCKNHVFIYTKLQDFRNFLDFLPELCLWASLKDESHPDIFTLRPILIKILNKPLVSYICRDNMH